MSKYHEAADVLKREAARYRALNDAAQALEEIGSLEQAAAEAAAKKDAALDELATTQAKLETTKNEVERVTSQLAETAVAAHNRTRQVMADADQRAGEIIDAAEQRAADIIQSGQNQASQELARMAEQIASMQGKLTEFTDQANAAMVRRDQADAAATEAEAKLAGVQDRIRKLSAAAA